MIQKLGRFRAVRQLYSAIKGRIQTSDTAFHSQRLRLAGSTVFGTLPLETISAQLREEGVCSGLNLPPELVDQLTEFAKTSPCATPEIDYEFLASSVKNGITAKGDRVDEGIVTRTEGCPAVQEIARDPQLIDIVRAHLNYWPNRIEPRLRWNFRSDERCETAHKRYAPSQFHYDVKGYNFMAAMFFLTPTTANCGAHVVIRQSHLKKPLGMLVHPGVQTMDSVRRHFPAENEMTVSGAPGFGFVEDVSCLHRAAPASDQDRLILIVRYS